LRQSTLFFVRNAFNEYFGIDGRLWLTLRLYLSATVLFFFILSVMDPVGKLERRLGGSMRDSTATVSTRQKDIREQLALKEQAVSGTEIVARSTSRRLDSVMTALRADSAAGAVADSAFTELSRRIDAASKAVEDSEQERLEEAERSRGTERTRLEWQLGVLDSYPPDSTVRTADLIDAAARLFPVAGDIEDLDLDILGAEGGSLSRLKQARTSTERRQAFADLARGAIRFVPIVLFFVLPVFALALKLIYVRRDWYFSEHLIFALHNHAVAFLAFSLMAIAIGVDGSGTLWSGGEEAVWADTFVSLLGLALLLYFFVAQKQFYGQGWIKTAVKSLVVFVTYIMGIGLMAIILLAILALMFG
jgi:hypothetical protein